MRDLTRSEEQIMQILWEIGSGFVKDVIARFAKPKPAYSTVSTMMRILVQKGFAGYKAYGKTHEYFPIVTKEQYRNFQTYKLLNSYYNDSLGSLVSSFLEKKKLDLREADEIMRLLRTFKEEEK